MINSCLLWLIKSSSKATLVRPLLGAKVIVFDILTLFLYEIIIFHETPTFMDFIDTNNYNFQRMLTKCVINCSKWQHLSTCFERYIVLKVVYCSKSN